MRMYSLYRRTLGEQAGDGARADPQSWQRRPPPPNAYRPITSGSPLHPWRSDALKRAPSPKGRGSDPPSAASGLSNPARLQMRAGHIVTGRRGADLERSGETAMCSLPGDWAAARLL